MIGLSFDSCSRAVCYADDVLARALAAQHRFIPRDYSPLRRRLKRRMTEAAPDTGPSLALARYALKQQAQGMADTSIARLWGCSVEVMQESIAMLEAEEVAPPKPCERAEQPTLALQ